MTLPQSRGRHHQICTLWFIFNLALTLTSLLVLFTSLQSSPSFFKSSLLFSSSTPTQPSLYIQTNTMNHLRLMTWNIRYDGKAQNHHQTWPIDTPPSQLNFSQPNNTYPQPRSYGEYPWALRRISLVSTVLLHHPAILTLQEVLPNQLEDLRQMLHPSYKAIGVGRDDASGLKGEAVPVFYRSDLFQLVPAQEGGVGSAGFQHFWLSLTPEIPGSIGWDASQTRMCTHLALRKIGSTQIIHLFSTHFDDQGIIARAQSAILLRAKANEAYRNTVNVQKGRQDAEEPLVMLMGDFNSPREEQAWRSLVAGKYDIPASEATSHSHFSKSSTPLPFLDSALSVPTLFKNRLQPSASKDESKSTWTSFLQRTLPRANVQAAVEERASSSSKYPFSIMPDLVGTLATFTDWGRKTGRREIDDEIDFIFLLDSPAVEDTTPSYISFPSQRGRLPSLTSKDDDEQTDVSLPQVRQVVAQSGAESSKSPEQDQEPRIEGEDDSTRAHPRAWSKPSTGGDTGKWHIAAYGVLSSWSDGEGGVRMSDHRPVLTRLVRG
ncbi:hypothetical protein CF326_g4671 [Tilletia indica]|nr:hypothetical protein CF326_g4671 [Tilletia indica]